MFKLFSKKAAVEELVAPMSGKVVQIEDVPDEVFSQKMIGDGIAIEPDEGVVVSPVDGEIVQFFPTKHAVGLKTKSGLEILIHIGMETVALNGEGFEGFVQQGDRVKAGDKLVSFDLEQIRERAESIISPVVITNFDAVDTLTKTTETSVKRGESVLLTVKMK
ncbi:PTS glucose transporter subunit IIA [Weizmannia coagulans]|uniref:PTS glucose transporter subunit IIA n=3 Tax=Heyndrickxia TaxID=2837504 RepID=A0A0C5C7Q6_HEYCO|nr:MULTISPECIES: PTS glucose transporter subunit IIA [Heyndrickxia]AJO21430.1 PTS glucose transporter subunit IIA [Heyndrickxia coagulans]AKN52943.1 PTS system, glucose-specific IIA component [Heyndrickxia coagulans]APB37318.1 PTS glucose transporter subunit IIA [Heyndrickxia coagulans]ATW82013.1 PTS glucose transporter subunit IIA [Heyndrickxia coagulans]AWP38267.1 PTS glucose transporter subunit IIA [Heyndrickxia coagulans]